jgi:hypothetical protein
MNPAEIAVTLSEAQSAFAKGDMTELDMIAVALAVNDELARLARERNDSAYMAFARMAEAGLLARAAELNRGDA